MGELPERTGSLIARVAAMTEEQAREAGWPDAFWKTAVRLMGADWRVATQIMDATGATVQAVDDPDVIELVVRVQDWDARFGTLGDMVPVRIHVARGASPEQLAELDLSQGPPPAAPWEGETTANVQGVGGTSVTLGWPSQNLGWEHPARETPTRAKLRVVSDE